MSWSVSYSGPTNGAAKALRKQLRAINYLTDAEELALKVQAGRLLVGAVKVSNQDGNVKASANGHAVIQSGTDSVTKIAQAVNVSVHADNG